MECRNPFVVPVKVFLRNICKINNKITLTIKLDEELMSNMVKANLTHAE